MGVLSNLYEALKLWYFEAAKESAAVPCISFC